MMDLVEVEKPDDVTGRAPPGAVRSPEGSWPTLVHCRAGKESSWAVWQRVVSSKRPSIPPSLDEGHQLRG
jgi:hypothetical protein